MHAQPDMSVFIDAAKVFFDSNLGKGQINAGTPKAVPYHEAPVYEYTGQIDLGGTKRGSIFFSSPAYLIKHILMAMGETDFDDDLVSDLVGEIVNTIAGGAQSHLGQGCEISPPIIYRDGQTAIIPKYLHPYVVPLTWRDHNSSIVVWFE